MTRLKSVALFAVAAALSSPVLAQDDPNQSAVNSFTRSEDPRMNAAGV